MRRDIALRLLAAGAAGVMLVALVMSWSRGALLGLATGAVLVTLALGRRTRALAIAALLVLVLAWPLVSGALPDDLLGRVTDTFAYAGAEDLTAIEITDANFSVVERAAHWLAAWRMFSARPWLGVGVGQYATAYAAVAVPRWEDPLGHAHNYYLNVLAEGGLLGLGAHLAFLGAATASAWCQARRQVGWRRGVALGTLGALGHLATHNTFDNLFVQGMYLLIAILLGVVVWQPYQPTPDGRAAAPVGAP